MGRKRATKEFIRVQSSGKRRTQTKVYELSNIMNFSFFFFLQLVLGTFTTISYHGTSEDGESMLPSTSSLRPFRIELERFVSFIYVYLIIIIIIIVYDDFEIRNAGIGETEVPRPCKSGTREQK